MVSACDSLDELLPTALERLHLHFFDLLEDGLTPPAPANLAEHQANPEYEGMMWAWVDMDLTRCDGRTQKINVTLPQSLIHRIDEKVNAHKALYKSRSHYLAQLALADLS